MSSHALFTTSPLLQADSRTLPTVSAPSQAAAVRRHALVRRLAAMVASLPLGTWVLADAGLLYLGTRVGFDWFVVGKILPYAHVQWWQSWAILTLAFVFASLVFGLHERETLLSRSRLLTRMMLTTVTAAIITYAVVYALLYTTLSRRVMGTAVGCLAIGGGTSRLLACWMLHRVRRNVLLIGPGALSGALVRAFREGFLSEYRLVGYVDDQAQPHSAIHETPRLGSTSELGDVCQRHSIDDIVVGAEAATDARLRRDVLPCLRRGHRVTNESTFYEKATGQILVDEITPHWFLFADLQVHCQRRQALKRAFDIVCAVFGLILALPLFPLLAVLIKLTDHGPIFYSQTRVGQNGQPFTLIKLRTMKVGAEVSEPVWAVKNDPRATPIGRFLRRTRLDELPQLVNILLGQMSLVGPRPERPELVVQLAEKIPFYNERHLVKPGLTGWAQIGFGYGSSVEDAKRKLQFDLYYIKHLSIELDLVILLRTLGVFLRGAQ